MNYVNAMHACTYQVCMCLLKVKDIHIKGVFRFIYKPLVDELPGFGAVTYSIRKKACGNYSISMNAWAGIA